MWNNRLSIDPALPIRLAVIAMENVRVEASTAAFDRLQACAGNYRHAYSSVSIGKIPGVEWARDFFHATGIDPTKRRPSSEALLHRALKGKALRSVNSLVDVGNWCSLDFLLPVCLYDPLKIAGSITVRLGNAGESYWALSDQIIHLQDRCLLADEEGPFGSPITDSKRTAVDEQTSAACLILFAPRSYLPDLLRQQMNLFATRVMETCGGAVKLSAVLDSTHHSL